MLQGLFKEGSIAALADIAVSSRSPLIPYLTL